MIHAPFDRMLWIDADCVVLRNLESVFSGLRRQPLFIRDGTAVRTENDQKLYEHLAIPPEAVTTGISVNSGVVGLCRFRDAAS